MNDVEWLNPVEERAWRGYTEMSARLNAHLHRSLARQTGLSLPDYEVLVHLSESPDDRLRAFELGAALQWEKSRLSHHLTRMERRGLVERQSCESDARGLFVVLTPEGRKAIEEGAPHHVSDVRSSLIDLLSTGQLETIAEISERVIAGLRDDAALCQD
jgi:DNA-binding MarR family transcriptional regulator